MPYTFKGHENSNRQGQEIYERVIDPLKTQADKLVEIAIKTNPEAGETLAADLLIHEIAEKVHEAKSAANDMAAANILSTIAFAIAATRDPENEDYEITYEEANISYYDVISVASGTMERPRINIPVPMVNPDFIQALEDKMKKSNRVFSYEERGEHNRDYFENYEEILNGAISAYTAIGTFANSVQIERFLSILDTHIIEPDDESGEYGVEEQKRGRKEMFLELAGIIRDCREAVSKGPEAVRQYAIDRLNRTHPYFKEMDTDQEENQNDN